MSPGRITGMALVICLILFIASNAMMLSGALGTSMRDGAELFWGFR